MSLHRTDNHGYLVHRIFDELPQRAGHLRFRSMSKLGRLQYFLRARPGIARCVSLLNCLFLPLVYCFPSSEWIGFVHPFLVIWSVLVFACELTPVVPRARGQNEIELYAVAKLDDRL